MAAEPIVRLSVKEDVFQANHRKYVRFAVAMDVVAVAATGLGLLPILLGNPLGPALGVDYVLVVATFLLCFWSLVAVAFRIVKLHVRFYADEEELQPNRLDVPHRSRLAAFWLHDVRRVRYEEVERAVHDSVWVSPGVELGPFGRWTIVMYLKDGSEAWVHDGPEIPEEAYRFLLGQLQRRNIPLEADE